jgi:PEP-CTERM motif
MRQLGPVTALALVLLVCAVPVAHAAPIPANATASYTASLSVSLIFAAPRGVAVGSANDAFLPNAVCLAMGVAGNTQCANPTSAFAANTLTFTAGPIQGWSGPGVGSASGVSFGTSETISLTNVTAGALNVRLSGVWTSNLATTAKAGGVAGASYSFEIDNTTGGMMTALFGPQEFAVLSPPSPSSNTCTNCPIAAFNVAVPAMSFVTINIDPFVSGKAISTPEPSSLLPLLGVAAAAWLRRRRFTYSE